MRPSFGKQKKASKVLGCMNLYSSLGRVGFEAYALVFSRVLAMDFDFAVLLFKSRDILLQKL